MSESEARPAKLSTAAIVAAYIILALFSLFVVYLLRQASVSDNEWSRLLYLFTGVEAIAFAALGALFGRRIERDNTDAANKRADDAEGDAKGNAAAANRERSLRAAINAEADQSVGRAPGVVEPLMPAQQPRAKTQLSTEGVGIAQTPSRPLATHPIGRLQRLMIELDREFPDP